MAGSTKWEAAAQATVASTELNSLANGSAALGAEYDNSSGLYIRGIFELNVTFGTNPTANSLINVYLVPAPDGSNYDDSVTGAGGSAPVTGYIGGFPLRAVTSAQKVPLGIGLQTIEIPPMKFKLLVLNNSGQSFPASGSTILLTPYRYQST